MKIYVLQVNSLCKIGVSEDPSAEASKFEEMHGKAPVDSWESVDNDRATDWLEATNETLKETPSSSGFFDIAFDDAVAAVTEDMPV